MRVKCAALSELYLPKEETPNLLATTRSLDSLNAIITILNRRRHALFYPREFSLVAKRNLRYFTLDSTT
jgi:hypothetical protein